MKEPESMDIFGAQGANSAKVSNSHTTSRSTTGTKELIDLTNYNLSDDKFFSVMMQQKEFCRKILEIILDKNFVSIEFNQVQTSLQTLPGYKSIRLDAFAVDKDGHRYNVEMQKRNNDDMPKRSRFYQGILDASGLFQGSDQRYENMTDVYVIFITDFDIFGKGLYKYTFTNKCDEVQGLPLGDGATRIFLNLKGHDDNNVTQGLKDLLHFIQNTTSNFVSSDLKVQDLVRLVKNLKGSEEVRKLTMRTDWLEERARAEAREEDILATLDILSNLGISKEVAIQNLKESFKLTEEEALWYYSKHSAK